MMVTSNTYEEDYQMIKQRNIAVCIILSLVTCGIYSLYWFICLSDDVNTAAGEQGTSGVMALVFSLITCGIYMFYWAYKQGEKLEKAKQSRGMASGSSGILYLVLCLLGLGIIAEALMQDSLNKLA